MYRWTALLIVTCASSEDQNNVSFVTNAVFSLYLVYYNFVAVSGRCTSLSISPVPGSENDTAGSVTATKRAGSVSEAFRHLCMVPRCTI
jgi:hypothetical protein